MINGLVALWQEEAARMLLFRGADRAVKNYANQTATDVAVITDNVHIADLIDKFRTADVGKLGLVHSDLDVWLWLNYRCYVHCMLMETEGTRQTWCVKKSSWNCVVDMESFGLSHEDAQDRYPWRLRVRDNQPTCIYLEI